MQGQSSYQILEKLENILKTGELYLHPYFYVISSSLSPEACSTFSFQPFRALDPKKTLFPI